MGRFWENNKTFLIQTVLALIAILSLMGMAERRLTAVETMAAAEHEARLRAEDAMLTSIREIQATQTKLSESVAMLCATVDQLNKRIDAIKR